MKQKVSEEDFKGIFLIGFFVGAVIIGGIWYLAPVEQQEAEEEWTEQCYYALDRIQSARGSNAFSCYYHRINNETFGLEACEKTEETLDNVYDWLERYCLEGYCEVIEE